jgi:hypothetical protein
VSISSYIASIFMVRLERLALDTCMFGCAAQLRAEPRWGSTVATQHCKLLVLYSLPIFDL